MLFNWRTADKIITQAFRDATSGDVDVAIAALRKAAAVSDPHGDRAEALGMICYHHSRWAEAAAAFALARQAQPASMQRLYFYASAASRNGGMEEAIAALDKAAGEFRDDVAPPSAKCLLLLERGDYASAVAAAETARLIFLRKPNQSAYSMGLYQQAADSLAQATPLAKPVQE